MRKQVIITMLTVATLLGSLFMMQASNMFFYDIMNMGAGLANSTIWVTLPAASIALFFVIAVLYLIRTYKRPDCRKRITRLYSIILVVLAGLGLLGDILSGVLIYHNFVGNHPFPGYLIIFLILNLILLSGGILGLVYAHKMEKDPGRTKITFRYVMKTIGWFLFICLVFNRFGTFLGSPAFIYWRNFYKTFHFYIYLLLPLCLGVYHVLFTLGILRRQFVFKISIILLAVNVAFFAYIAIMGINDTMFVSSLSQAMPLERAASKPVELPIHFLANAGVAVALLIRAKKEVQE